MSDDAAGCMFFVMALLAFVAGLVIGLTLGDGYGEDRERRAAVKAGVARWQADPATGAVRFEYRGGKR